MNRLCCPELKGKHFRMCLQDFESCFRLFAANHSCMRGTTARPTPESLGSLGFLGSSPRRSQAPAWLKSGHNVDTRPKNLRDTRKPLHTVTQLLNVTHITQPNAKTCKNTGMQTPSNSSVMLCATCTLHCRATLRTWVSAGVPWGERGKLQLQSAVICGDCSILPSLQSLSLWSL